MPRPTRPAALSAQRWVRPRSSARGIARWRRSSKVRLRRQRGRAVAPGLVSRSGIGEFYHSAAAKGRGERRAPSPRPYPDCSPRLVCGAQRRQDAKPQSPGLGALPRRGAHHQGPSPAQRPLPTFAPLRLCATFSPAAHRHRGPILRSAPPHPHYPTFFSTPLAPAHRLSHIPVVRFSAPGALKARSLSSPKTRELPDGANIGELEGMNDASTSPPNARRMCRASPS